MMRKGMAVLLSLSLFLLSIGTGGCSAQKENQKENGLHIAINSETGSLDPAGMIALTYLAYSAAALDELLTFDENGDIVYRAATSYEVDETDTVWTFHLRKDGCWSDGTPVTSKDFVNTMTRALDPASGNGYANYLFPIINAEEIYQGKKDVETLGVEVPDDYTLVIRLKQPCAYFLDLLRLPVYTPSCSAYADAVGSGWDKNPETSLSNGPFCLTEYVSEQYFVLEKNPYYWDADSITMDQLTYHFFENQQSMADAYATGEVDVAVSLPASVMEVYEGEEDLVVTDSIATRYIYPNLQVEPLQDVRVREALNLALDREALCQIVGADTEPTYHLVAKYMKNKTTGKYFVDEGEIPFEENVEKAKQLLAEAGYPNGEGFPVLTYKYPALEQDMDTAQVLKDHWKKNLNIDIQLEAQELQVNYADRHASQFELCRMNWTADFADPNTYLSMLLSNSTYNCSGISDEAYDTLVKQSDIEPDADKRNQLMHEAELLAVGEQFYIIPLYTMKQCNLIRPNVKGIKQIPATGALDYRNAYWEN